MLAVVQSKPTSSGESSVTTLQVTMDSAIPEGYRITAQISTRFSGGAMTVPEGWTLVDDSGSASSRTYILERDAGEDESTTITHEWATARRATMLVAIRPPCTVDKSEAANSRTNQVNTQTTGTTAETADAPQLAVAYFGGASHDAAGGSGGTISGLAFNNSFTEVLQHAVFGAIPWVAIAELELETTQTAECTITLPDSNTDEMSGVIITYQAIAQPLAAGTATTTNRTATTVDVEATDATGGTSPYTYQWHRSTTQGFTPGGGNAVAGATSLTLSDSGLTDDTTYYYKLVYTDDDSATVTSNEVEVTTSNTPVVVITDEFGNTDGVIELMGPASCHFQMTDSLLGAGSLLNAKIEWEFPNSGGGYSDVRGFSAARLWDYEPVMDEDFTVRCTITNLDGESAFAERTVRITPNTRDKVYIDPDTGSGSPTDPSDPQDPYDTPANAWAGTSGSDLEFILTAGKTHAWASAFSSGSRHNILVRSTTKGTKFNVLASAGIAGSGQKIGVRDIHFEDAEGESAMRILDPRNTSNDPGGGWVLNVTSDDPNVLATVGSEASRSVLFIDVQTADDTATNNAFFSGPLMTFLGCDIAHSGSERPFRGDGNHILFWGCKGTYGGSAGKTAFTRDGGSYLYVGGGCEFRNSGTGVPMHIAHTTGSPGPDPICTVVERTLAVNTTGGVNNVGIHISPGDQGVDGLAMRHVLLDNGQLLIGNPMEGRLVKDITLRNVSGKLEADAVHIILPSGERYENISCRNCLGVGYDGTTAPETLRVTSNPDNWVSKGLDIANNVMPVVPDNEDVRITGNVYEAWATFNARAIGSGNKSKNITLDSLYRPTDVTDADILVTPPADMAQFAEDYYGNPRGGELWVAGAVGVVPTFTPTCENGFLSAFRWTIPADYTFAHGIDSENRYDVSIKDGEGANVIVSSFNVVTDDPTIADFYEYWAALVVTASVVGLEFHMASNLDPDDPVAFLPEQADISADPIDGPTTQYLVGTTACGGGATGTRGRYNLTRGRGR